MTNDEKFTEPRPDRAPTPAEEAAADVAAKDVDVEAVAKEFEQMNDLGAEVKGEGQIEGTPPAPHSSRLD